jgi:hypothetical protein
MLLWLFNKKNIEQAIYIQQSFKSVLKSYNTQE